MLTYTLVLFLSECYGSCCCIPSNTSWWFSTLAAVAFWAGALRCLTCETGGSRIVMSPLSSPCTFWESRVERGHGGQALVPTEEGFQLCNRSGIPTESFSYAAITRADRLRRYAVHLFFVAPISASVGYENWCIALHLCVQL